MGWLSRLLPALIALTLACTGRQRLGQLGDLELEGGGVIRDCRIGYRTFGALDPSRANAVLVTTWFQGTSGEMARQIGRGRLVDSSRYFVIVVDALGNGVSSSPSNSPLQPGGSFPRFTVRDMVESQHRLVTRVLGLQHLRAVVGISLGGMQAFQWGAAHPGFADKIVSIMGSPRSEPQDRSRWEDAIGAVRGSTAWRRAVQALARGSPLGALRELRVDGDDYVSQAEAVVAHDLTAPFGGSMARAAAAIRPALLVIGTPRDEVVSFGPALELARLARAEVVELDGPCGHQASSCERRALWLAVARFLAR